MTVEASLGTWAGYGCATYSQGVSVPLFGKLTVRLLYMWQFYSYAMLLQVAPSLLFLNKGSFCGVSDKSGFEASLFLSVRRDIGSVSKLGSPCFLNYIVIVNVWLFFFNDVIKCVLHKKCSIKICRMKHVETFSLAIFQVLCLFPFYKYVLTDRSTLGLISKSEGGGCVFSFSHID